MISSGHDILLSPSCIVHSVWTASTANHSSCQEEVVSAGLASSVSPGKTTPVCRPDQSVLLLIALHCSSGALCSKSFHFGIGHSPSPLEISAGNGLVLCGLVLEWRLKEFRVPFDWLLYSVVIIIIQGLTCLILEIKVPTMKRDDREYYSRLARACRTRGEDTGPFYGSNGYFHMSGSSVGLTALLISLPGLWLAMYLIPKSWKRLPESAMRRIHWKKIKLGLSTIVLLFLSYLLAGCIMLLVDVSGEVKENNWGYGQTTAVLLWAPFFFETIAETVSKYVHHPQGFRILKMLQSMRGN